MTMLCDIAWKYKTDKCPQIKHHFTEFYYDLFQHRRLEVKKVVEIGIGCMEPYFVKGASLYMWRDYFPNAMIYGADILPELMFSDERIETVLCDQTKYDDLRRLVEITGQDVDLFVDDGLHMPESQVFTCLNLMPLINENVTYIIEDVGRLDDVLHYIRDYDCQVIVPRRRKYTDDRMVAVRRYV